MDGRSRRTRIRGGGYVTPHPEDVSKPKESLTQCRTRYRGSAPSSVMKQKVLSITDFLSHPPKRILSHKTNGMYGQILLLVGYD